MKHPLDKIPSSSRKPLFWALLIGTLILFAVFQRLDAPLRTSAAPNGIVSFELAGTPEQAHVQLLSWDAEARLHAAFSLGIDYLFMPVYATALALGILLVVGKHGGWFGRLGAWLGWGSYAAATFDAVENYALWKILLGDVFSSWPAVAALCATVKFVLLLLGLIYAVVGWLWPRRL